MDKCVKENKNQYMMWLQALLVELLVFDKVWLVNKMFTAIVRVFIVCPGTVNMSSTSLAFSFLC